MRIALVVLCAMLASPVMAATSCEGVPAHSNGAYAATSKEAVYLAMRGADAGRFKPDLYSKWMTKMVENGQLVFVPFGTRLCALEVQGVMVRVRLAPLGCSIYLQQDSVEYVLNQRS